MEESWENWDLHMEMDCHDDFFEECHPEDDEFFKDIILQQPPAALSSESESDNSFHDSSNIVQNNSNNIPTVVVAAAADGGGVISPHDGNMVKSNSSNSIVSQQGSKRPRRSLSPRTYILSFDNSTMTPSTPEPCFNNNQLLGTEGTTLPSKAKKHEPKQGAIKRGRSSSQTTDHIMAERKRRQELTERFIALSATIPSLNKTDKASVLRAAIDYVKQLQERVEELEKQDNNKRGAESVIFIKKPDIRGNIGDNNNNYSETSSSDYCNILPEIEARILGKELLIEIHCEKENGIELKILDHLENLDLSVTSSNALPFGNFSLYMTIITQMGEEYKMTVNDLVKNLRQVLLKSPMPCDSDPY